MDELQIIVWLLPIVFIMHDFEEIIFFKPWVTKNSLYLKKRFPFLDKRLLPRMEALSVPAFALAVFEEFILLCIITFTAFYFDYYSIWLAVFMAFFIHLFAHIIQWIVLRRYIPAIVTAILALLYCIYGFIVILRSQLFTVPEIILLSLAGVFFMVVNLLLAHGLAEKFDKKRSIE
ncbi:uncharacterized protein with HXXEE motif [Dysgonomonas alginatilytica]|uniref:Uncharacterized protein with HXXEE motif n=1 Tax=Dysgonomonas alginatilytica TaxID=1605892 RepID=A0A2V3PTZ5_9BACT|nr:HXXEE domain-containing protein [Dysgonomonas alginatilytica]PXV67377.1 uncharacterized protein with HXXEE motif [Dysgonomonas alginatilytica]